MFLCVCASLMVPASSRAATAAATATAALDSVVMEDVAATVRVNPLHQPTARAQRLLLKGRPQILLKGKWSAADDLIQAPLPTYPNQPALFVSFSFSVSSSMRVINPEQTIIAPTADPSDRSLSRYTIEARLTAPNVTVEIDLVSSRGDLLPMSFQVQLDPKDPLIVADPACGEFGISAEAGSASSTRPAKAGIASHPGAAFVRCIRRGSFLEVKLWSWSAYHWLELPRAWSASWRRNAKQPVMVTRRPLYPASGSTEEMAFGLARPGEPGKSATLVLTHREVRAPSWVFSASLGPTWSTYHETAAGLADVKVSQMGLTAKVQTQFRVFPPNWDMAFSLFGTVLPLTSSDSQLPKARWIGLNGRVGYQLPLDRLKRNTISIMPGFYAWSMLVSGGGYGVQNLNGPQLVIAFNHEQGTRIGKFAMLQRFGAYFKCAAVSAGFSIDPADNELAAGAQVTVRIFAIPRPLVFSTDYSRLRFGSGSFAMELSTISVSLGASLF